MRAIRFVASVSFAASILTLPAVADAAQRGDFQLRGRVITIAPNDSSGAISGVPDSGVTVDSQPTLEVDFTWFLAPNVAIELIAATAEHDMSGKGSASALGKIADAGVLPPTVTLQYRWNTDGKVQPYVGGGINYTHFYSEDTTASLDDFLGTSTEADMDDSWGWALQAGMDVRLRESSWFFNVDLKYVDIDSTAVIRDADTGARLASVDVEIDPFIPGVGIGYRW